MTTREKIAALRSLMTEHGMAAYIIPPTDPHQSEYIADHWKTRSWISGFTGSAGVIVVTHTFAGVWTDSRYFIQAEKELYDSGIELVKLKIPHTPEYIEWLNDNLPNDSTIGIDGKVIAESLVLSMKKSFSTKNIKLNCGLDLPGMIWKDRPGLNLNEVYEHHLKFAGKSRAGKLDLVRAEMRKNGADYQLLTSLDDIAWLFNLRGSDVKYNPVFVSYALISQTSANLFVDNRKFSPSLLEKLQTEVISVQPYEAVDNVLLGLEIGSKILLSYAKTSHYLTKIIPPFCEKLDSVSIPTLLKAKKDDTEIARIKNAMIKDGVALVKFYKWLEENIGKQSINELFVDEKLTAIRSTQPDFAGNSFETIVGYKDHGAIIHYSATPETAYEIKPEGLLLLDSGGQYQDGTTDITRTTSLGKSTDEVIKDYTLVLKGLINLSMVVFPEGTKGFHLDILARKALWSYSKNYGHGTGHGVGYFLNVHEGPQGITPNAAVNAPLEAGMIQSNEPGYYREGKYGIRLENLILVTEHSESESGKFLQFETLTLFPFDMKLIDFDILTEEEKGWLNRYHKKVFENLSPKLNQEENQWLLEKTKEIK